MNLTENNSLVIKRILLLAADGVLPGPTYSGNAVIRWGLVSGLRSRGIDVGYYAAANFDTDNISITVDDVARLFGEGRFWFNRAGAAQKETCGQEIDEALRAFRPDVVMVYGLKGLRAMRWATFSGPVGVMSVDLEFLPRLYKWAHFIKAGDLSQRRTAMRRTTRTIRKALRIRKEVRAEYARADFVINHAAHHAAWHRRKHGLPVLYTPNPVEQLAATAPLRERSWPPRFMLLGGLAGTATLAGLEWFANRVYPLLESHIERGDLEVHLVGRMDIPTPIHRRMRFVTKRGYVSDLQAEMRRTTAVLVPTPIKLGFRTRILDAFRNGVTVVAHSANALGMPEMIDGRNARLARSARAFARAVLDLASDPRVADALGRRAFDDFAEGMNADVVGEKVITFIESSVMPTFVGRRKRHEVQR